MVVLDVVVRCRNEMPYAPRALDALLDQHGVEPRLIVFECGSTDGSREEVVARGLSFVHVDPISYVPGRVLNAGMAATTSPLVAFVNADAIARDRHALEALIEPFQRPEVAATFARQVPRPDASRATRVEHARAFGERAPTRVRNGAFFSMAASAVRRATWEALPFDEELRYSEDVDWTTRVRALGWGVEYVPGAVFEHSHEYDLRAAFRRRRGEGLAEASIARLGAPSVLDDLVRPLGGALLRDLGAGVLSIPRRVAEATGYWAGRRAALRA
ncbi:MAG: glycosyltransferase [Sandaracinaceae bacterium]|nr:glycosyltransferase [Sandaracinaceae bacterium]